MYRSCTSSMIELLLYIFKVLIPALGWLIVSIGIILFIGGIFVFAYPTLRKSAEMRNRRSATLNKSNVNVLSFGSAESKNIPAMQSMDEMKKEPKYR